MQINKRLDLIFMKEFVKEKLKEMTIFEKLKFKYWKMFHGVDSSGFMIR